MIYLFTNIATCFYEGHYFSNNGKIICVVDNRFYEFVQNSPDISYIGTEEFSYILPEILEEIRIVTVYDLQNYIDKMIFEYSLRKCMYMI
jgi:hypothetical protein